MTVFEENVIDTHYPQRPGAMGSVCLYDFVALYVFDGRDRHGESSLNTKVIRDSPYKMVA